MQAAERGTRIDGHVLDLEGFQKIDDDIRSPLGPRLFNFLCFRHSQFLSKLRSLIFSPNIVQRLLEAQVREREYGRVKRELEKGKGLLLPKAIGAAEGSEDKAKLSSANSRRVSKDQ